MSSTDAGSHPRQTPNRPGGLGLRRHGRQPAQREEAAMQGRRVWAHAAFLVAALSAGLVAGPAIVNAATSGSGASPEVIAATSQGVLASGNRTNVVLAACDEIGGVVLESGGTTLYMFQPDGTIVWQGTVNGRVNNPPRRHVQPAGAARHHRHPADRKSGVEEM